MPDRDYDKMARFRRDAERAARRDRAPRRRGSDMFPAAGPEIDEQNARLVTHAEALGVQLRDRAWSLCTFDEPCNWCSEAILPEAGSGATANPNGTARITVVPAKYTPAGEMVKPAVFAFACFHHLISLRYVSLVAGAVTVKEHVESLEQADRAERAAERARNRAAQSELFPDERLHTDPLRNG